MTKIDDDFTKIHEGLRLAVYRDTQGLATIGYGHNLIGGNNQHIVALGLSPRELIKGTIRLNEAQADALFDMDMQDAITAVIKLVSNWYLLPVQVQGILKDLCFNMGAYTLSTFHNTLRLINTGRYREASLGLVSSKWYHQVGERAKTIVAALRLVPDGLSSLDSALTGPLADNPEPNHNPLDKVNEKGINIWDKIIEILTKLNS